MKNSKLKKGIVISITIVSLFVLSIFPVFANSLEYNDVKVYIGNVLKTTIALRSDQTVGQNQITYFDVVLRLSDNHVMLCMYGGQPIDTGQTVTGLSQVNATQKGSPVTVTYINSANIGGVAANGTGPVFRVQYNTYYYLDPISLSINNSSVKLETPVLTSSGNTISWEPIANASGYNIQFAENGQYTSIVTNYQSTTYSFTRSGSYVVQALGQGSFYNSDWSDSISVTYEVEDSSGGILSWLSSRLSEFTNSLQLFYENSINILQNVGQVFTSLTSFMPEAYANMVWSLAGIMLIFGIFRLF